MVEYEYITGFPKTAFPILNRTIDDYKNQYPLIKIGITGQDPKARFRQHKHQSEHRWKKMLVIYATTSENFANRAESWLVEEHYNCLVNRRSGGSSQLSSEEGTYYVYLLVG